MVSDKVDERKCMTSNRRQPPSPNFTHQRFEAPFFCEYVQIDLRRARPRCATDLCRCASAARQVNNKIQLPVFSAIRLRWIAEKTGRGVSSVRRLTPMLLERTGLSKQERALPGPEKPTLPKREGDEEDRDFIIYATSQGKLIEVPCR